MYSFKQAEKLLRKNKVRYVDIVKKGLVETRTYKNTELNVAYIDKPVTDKWIIYKYDPREYNGFPLLIGNNSGSNLQGLIVYDSSSSEYDIENNHEISTYHYVSTEFVSKPRFEPKSRVQETPMLISTTRSTPVIIWNTKAEIMFGVDETYNHTYNIFEQNETITGALRTLVDDSENSQYFRKGLRVFGGSYNDNENFEPLIGTNTYLISGGRFNTRKGNDGDDIVSITHLPEYKPFYFFFGPQNYEDAERAFLEHVTINLKYDSVKPRLALSLAFMRIVDALIESKKCNCDKFDEKFLRHLEKIVDDIFDYPKAT